MASVWKAPVKIEVVTARSQSERDKTKVYPTCLALPASVVEGGTNKETK